MTAIVTGTDYVPRIFRPAGDQPVFVAEQRAGTSDAHATAHLGHATLVAWLDPIREGDAPAAQLRMPGGGLMQVRADAVYPAAAIAARRLGPAPFAARRSA